MHGGAHAGRRPARRVCAGLALGVAAVALVGCGARAEQASTIATPVAPPALPTRTEVPASQAVEPVVPGTTPAPDPGTSSKAKAPNGQKSRAGKSHAAASILSGADRASFQRLAASLGGQQGVAVSGLGLGREVERAGSIRTAVAWSTGKVPVAMAVFAAGGDSTQHANLGRALTASDNAAAQQLWTSLGGGQAAAHAADEQLRIGGDKRTNVESRALRGDGYTAFGQTSWALTDQTRFTAGLPCSQAGLQVLALMNQIVAGQRWGLGSAGVDAQFKGGWGPGSTPGVNGGYLDRQMGVLMIHGRPLAVSIASRPTDGSHETGTRNLTAVARWIVAHADVRRLPARPSC